MESLFNLAHHLDYFQFLLLNIFHATKYPIEQLYHIEIYMFQLLINNKKLTTATAQQLT